jgi:hypothetical protein
MNDAKIGDNVRLHIKTKPNSFVGLLAVEENATLLKNGNDIDADSVFQKGSSKTLESGSGGLEDAQKLKYLVLEGGRLRAITQKHQ